MFRFYRCPHVFFIWEYSLLEISEQRKVYVAPCSRTPKGTKGDHCKWWLWGSDGRGGMLQYRMGFASWTIYIVHLYLVGQLCAPLTYPQETSSSFTGWQQGLSDPPGLGMLSTSGVENWHPERPQPGLSTLPLYKESPPSASPHLWITVHTHPDQCLRFT